MNTATEDPRLDRVTPEDNRVDVTPDTSLFPPDRLVEHARHLGASHKVERQPRGRGRGLLARLDAAAERLETVYRALSASPDDGRLPSEDWIRDNFYVVADQVRQVRTDLPTRYYLELPRLAEGPSAGYPRVYALASELIAHSDNRVDVDVLRTFVLAYQETHPLRIGEIWAIPIMLRMALVERLCALADDVLRGRRDRARAQEVVVLLEQQAAAKRGRLWRWRSEIELPESFTPPFVVELLRGLRDRPPSMAPAWAQLLEPLQAQGGADAMIRQEAQLEASMQVSIGNAITSMRMLSALDWPTFVEHVSHVERVLRDDPAGAYARMDFATRDRYRQSVEQLARGSRVLGDRGRQAGLCQSRPRPVRQTGRRAPASRRLLPGVAWSIRARVGSAVCPAQAGAIRPVRLPAPGPGVFERDRGPDSAWRREPDRQRRPTRRVGSDAAAGGAGHRGAAQ